MNPRPTKKETEKLTQSISFFCTIKEQQEIEAIMKSLGYNKRSDYLRRVALGYEIANRKKAGLE
jgi:hypothetical protein